MKRYLPLLFAVIFTSNAFTKEQIPIEHFWCESAMTSGSLSPDGRYFAAMIPASGPKCSIDADADDDQSARVLLVRDLQTNKL